MNILAGTLNKRYVVIVHQYKIQKYGFFDSEKECEKWWMDHKHPFFENDRPKDWGVSFVATYDTIDDKIIEWNKLWVNKELVDKYVKQFLDEFEKEKI
jgi:hypothetical protein